MEMLDCPERVSTDFFLNKMRVYDMRAFSWSSRTSLSLQTCVLWGFSVMQICRGELFRTHFIFLIVAALVIKMSKNKVKRNMSETLHAKCH